MTDSPELMLFAFAISTLFSFIGSYVRTMKIQISEASFVQLLSLHISLEFKLHLLKIEGLIILGSDKKSHELPQICIHR